MESADINKVYPTAITDLYSSIEITQKNEEIKDLKHKLRDTESDLSFCRYNLRTERSETDRLKSEHEIILKNKDEQIKDLNEIIVKERQEINELTKSIEKNDRLISSDDDGGGGSGGDSGDKGNNHNKNNNSNNNSLIPTLT
jgi:predicted RNase H-like nuclease (RuvC/YqgF family)